MIKNWHFYLIIVTIYSVIIFISNKYVLTSDLYYKSFSNQLTIEQIDDILLIHKNFRWTAYLLQAMILLIKIILVNFCIYVGLIFSNIKVNYKDLFKVTLSCETIFILYSAIRLILIYFKGIDNLEQIQTYWPISLYSLFSSNSIPTWAIYPLSAMNFAQIVYWLLLAFGITLLLKTNYQKSFRIVMSSYGIGFLCWMLLVIFLQVYFLPSGTV